MRSCRVFVLLAALFAFALITPAPAAAQFGKLKDKVKDKVERKVDQKTDQAIDKALEKPAGEGEGDAGDETSAPAPAPEIVSAVDFDAVQKIKYRGNRSLFPTGPGACPVCGRAGPRPRWHRGHGRGPRR